MTLAEIALPMKHSDDSKQTLRMHRYFIAAGTAVMVIWLLFACYLMGILNHGAFLRSSIVILFWILFFYMVFQSGLNLRMRDPSLTAPQMSASTLTILYVMYAADVAHAVFPIILVMIFLFGVLR